MESEKEWKDENTTKLKAEMFAEQSFARTNRTSSAEDLAVRKDCNR